MCYCEHCIDELIGDCPECLKPCNVVYLGDYTFHSSCCDAELEDIE